VHIGVELPPIRDPGAPYLAGFGRVGINGLGTGIFSGSNGAFAPALVESHIWAKSGQIWGHSHSLAPPLKAPQGFMVGFMVGRSKTSLTNEVLSCVTSMATTVATSPGWIILLRSFELPSLPK
jgi:hypothetical protein